MKRTKKKSKDLPWEYCECGCHGSEINIGGTYFWTLTDFPKGVFNTSGPDGDPEMIHHLNDGHKWGTHLGTFKTRFERDKFVKNILKEKMKELKEVL